MTEQKTQSLNSRWTFVRKVVVRALLFFVLFNLIFIAFGLAEKAGKFSTYTLLYPGRERLPFGENSRKSYNLSLFNLEAMINSHLIHGVGEKPVDEFRVIVIGDSSMWGTLLRPEETFTGLLNQEALRTANGRDVVFYNLAYPSLAVSKDLLILNEMLVFNPDLIVWAVTLESMSIDAQKEVPLVSQNINLLEGFSLSYIEKADLNPMVSMWNRSIVGERRAIADLIRLKVYGFLWGATEIDQEYPDNYPLAARDLFANEIYRNLEQETFHSDDLAFEALQAGIDLMNDVPIVFINEPILISEGKNSDIRYNFLYPQWAYDDFRIFMNDFVEENDLIYYDFWNVVPEKEFSNSAVHLTIEGEKLFVQTFLTKAIPAIIK